MRQVVDQATRFMLAARKKRVTFDFVLSWTGAFQSL
jgi:hypothetical protein